MQNPVKCLKIGRFRGKNKPFNAQNPTFRGWDAAFKSVFVVCFVACLGGVGCVPGRSRPLHSSHFRFLQTRVQTQCGGNGRKDADNGLDNHFPGFFVLHIQLRFYVKVCRDAACCVRPFWRCSVRPCWRCWMYSGRCTQESTEKVCVFYFLSYNLT